MNKERWTKTAIRRAVYDHKGGGYIARKETHAGCTDYVLLNYKTMEPRVYKTAEEALTAKANKNYGWYH